MNFLPAEIIKKKRGQLPLSEEEISFFINGYTTGSIPDYQMSALLMAIFFNSMTTEETLALTKTMLNSGTIMDFSDLAVFKVDKHSTGGVGDKTSLILGPIVAAAGLAVPMISGRGLGHTGGTLDKLESIPGFNTQLSLEKFRSAIKKSGICFIGQTKEICPADKKIYALRDVTATVESLPLICASIMSKKLAEGIDGLVLDVKFGSGAFMKTAAAAEELAFALMNIGRGYGKKVSAVLSSMNQPLGKFAGNSLEVEECLGILRGENVAPDTTELSLKLAGMMLYLGGVSSTEDKGIEQSRALLNSGKAYEKFEQLCTIHGGNINALPRPKKSLPICSLESGYLSQMNTEAIGIAGIKIKAGRAKADDVIRPTSGIEFHKKIGEQVQVGEPVFTIWGDDTDLLRLAKPDLERAFVVSEQLVAKDVLIFKTLT